MITTIASLLFKLVLATGVLLLIALTTIRIYFYRLKSQQRSASLNKNINKNTNNNKNDNNDDNDNQQSSIHVGIMHPYSTGGGGGERVLWFMIRSLHELSPRIHVTLYTTDPRPFPELRQLVRETFNIELDRPIDQKQLFGAKRWLTPSRFLTLFMHSVASAVVGWEALTSFVPDVFMDTHGCAESFFVAKWFAGCRTVCYVHYPTISTDMLQRVSQRVSSYNNDEQIVKSSFRSQLKLWYYRLYASMYGFVGMSADVVMVNSTWTKNHIESIWWRQRPNRVHIVYPPVAVHYFRDAIPLSLKHGGGSKSSDDGDEDAKFDRMPWILSIGQFRPEKDHALMLRSFKAMLSLLNDHQDDEDHQQKQAEESRPWISQVRLVLLGGCRGTEDEQRVSQLKQLAKDLGIDDRVDFIVNAPFSTLTRMLSQCVIGLHTMWNEHFGICVVEYMVAGLIPLAHDSAGPKMDIVVDYESKRTGFLASTEQEYARYMSQILNGFFQQPTTADNDDGSNNEMRAIQANARQSTDRFSEEQFVTSAKTYLSALIPPGNSSNRSKSE